MRLGQRLQLRRRRQLVRARATVSHVLQERGALLVGHGLARGATSGKKNYRKDY
jgi:hypothetical protein